jgi:hypothetical protein
MEYEMTLYIANNKLNKFMEDFDLKPQHKFYITIQRVSFEKSSEIKDDFFYKIIKSSKDNKDNSTFWIPAIEFCGKIYKDKDIKELSDGIYTRFLT